MKKGLLFAVIIGGLVFTSCTKRNDYDCTCTATTYGQTTAEITNATDDEAEKFCTDLGSTCTLSKK